MADTKDDEFEKFLEECLCSFNVKELKPEQRRMLDCLLSGTNSVCILPTGYGKSLPYQVYIPLLRMMHETRSTDLDSEAKIVICSPLIALMEDQVKRLTMIPNLSAGFRGNAFSFIGKICKSDRSVLQSQA